MSTLTAAPKTLKEEFVHKSIKLGAIAVFVLACGRFGSFAADYPTTVLSEQPVGYWRLNETTQPSAPKPAANAGSLGSAGDGQYRFGPKRGEPGALAGNSATSVRFFNETHDVSFGGTKVEVPYNPKLNPTGPFSVEFWARPTSIVKDDFCPVASINSDSAIGPSANTMPRAGWLFYQATNSTGGNEWEFRLGNAASTNSDPSYIDGDAIRGGIITTGAWHYVVGTFDGSQAVLYVNGQQVSSRAITGYRANDARPFRIGTTCFDGALGAIGTYAGNRGFDGWLEEVAFYGTALSANDVAAHYNAGETNGAGYASVVLANKPIGYWRLGEPGNPPAANIGTLGSAGDGQYIYSAHPGQGGPLPPAFPGFESTNRAVAFSGTNGLVDLPPLNLNTNTVTMTAWLLASETEANNAGIVFSRGGTTVAGLKFDVSDPNGLSYNWNADDAAANFKSGLTVPIFQWCFVALIVQPDQATLCLQDGVQFSTAVNFATHPEQAFEGDTVIGADPQDGSLTFHGIIDEVAIFNRALSVGEVYSIYAASVGAVKPSIFGDVHAPADAVYVGDTLSLSVDAGGTAPLTYQWRKDGNPITGATSSSFSKAGATAADAGKYDVVVSNAQGSITSTAATITVQPLTQPAISQDPQGRTIYSGGLINLSVQASGGGLHYQWQRNGTNVVGATNATYTVGSASAANAGTYQVIVMNQLNSKQSASTTVGVIVPAAGSYGEVIVGDAPEAWWRLDEPAGAGTLTDAMGRHDGAFKGGVTLGRPGVIVGDTNTAATFDGFSGYAEIPFSKSLNTSAFTVECWAKAEAVVPELAAVGSFTQPPGRGFSIQKSSDGQYYYMFGDGQSTSITYITGSDAIYTNWTHLAVTYDGTNYIGYLNGVFDAGATAPVIPNNVAPFRIGYDQSGDGWNDFWNGDIDEVAYYQKALTEEQIAAHYAAGLYGHNSKPVFVKQPKSGMVVTNDFFVFNPTVEGSAPLAFQWSKNGVPIQNETNFYLVFGSADVTNSGSYQLTATNNAGTTTSAAVTLAVLPQPDFANVTNGLVLHLSFDGNLLDSSGRTNNGTAVGALDFPPGQIGKAVHVSTTVDNSDPNDPIVSLASYITLHTRPDLQFSSNVDFSISYWVNFTGDPGDLPFFCNSINSYQNPGYTFAPSYQQGSWSWSLGNVHSTDFIGIYGQDSIGDGNWHQIAHTFDRSGSGFTYVDGVLVDTRSIVPAGDLDTGEATTIGQDASGEYPEAADLIIDDIGVWRRVLTSFEISSIYAAGQAGKSFDKSGSVTLVVTSDANKVQIAWQAGTLLEANDATGPWTPVAGAASPLYQVSPGVARKFYRVQL
jgi:hypothetical protein